VKRGDVIGYVGSTGRATSAHLHYEILLNGQPINPLRLLARP
jgi:murein DD-endopeptidase MepM/ murein hydrolase activator NlpD